LQQQNQAKSLSKKLSKYWRLPEILAHSKILALAQNIGAFSKYRRIFKI
jgi:hypothetical protein